MVPTRVFVPSTSQKHFMPKHPGCCKKPQVAIVTLWQQSRMATCLNCPHHSLWRYSPVYDFFYFRRGSDEKKQKPLACWKKKFFSNDTPGLNQHLSDTEHYDLHWLGRNGRTIVLYFYKKTQNHKWVNHSLQPSYQNCTMVSMGRCIRTYSMVLCCCLWIKADTPALNI